MKKIAFINIYFGAFPKWFPAFLKSCETQDNIDFLFFTNATLPEWYPNNVRFFHITDSQLKQRCIDKTGLTLNLNQYYKLCDLKPMYGHWFEDHIKSYAYWGHCDIDLIWGNLSEQLSPLLEKRYDVIKGQKTIVSGHCAVFKNIPKVSKLYLKSKHLAKVLSSDRYECFDEKIMSNEWYKYSNDFNIHDEQLLFNFYYRDTPTAFKDGRIPPSFNHFRWENGHLIEIGTSNKSEMIYLHFRNWKNKLKLCPTSISTTDKFYISSTQIHTRKLTPYQISFEYFKVIGIVIRKKIQKLLK